MNGVSIAARVRIKRALDEAGAEFAFLAGQRLVREPDPSAAGSDGAVRS